MKQGNALGWPLRRDLPAAHGKTGCAPSLLPGCDLCQGGDIGDLPASRGTGSVGAVTRAKHPSQAQPPRISGRRRGGSGNHAQLWCFELRDRTQPHIVLTGELQLNVIELRKADRLLPQHAGKLAAWVAWFEHWHEESIMSAITHRPVQQAMEQLKGLSADDEMRRLAFVRERALHDEVSFTNAAREEGRVLGREEGLEKGREEGQLKLLERQLQRKFGPLSGDTRTRL
ncbi:MAG: hypothetical protein Q7J47_00430 [Azoarcus sp.]|nr:hypothetical protein [Azoarcus sp.]